MTALHDGLQNQNIDEPKGKFLSALSITRRRKLPTSISNDRILSARTKKRRVEEIFQAALEIIGASTENPQPVVVGSVETLNSPKILLLQQYVTKGSLLRMQRM